MDFSTAVLQTVFHCRRCTSLLVVLHAGRSGVASGVVHSESLHGHVASTGTIVGADGSLSETIETVTSSLHAMSITSNARVSSALPWSPPVRP